jgi:hypothetical protein
MKKVLLALCCLMALAACQKKNAPLFRGDYSFKTSGSVVLDEIVTDGEKGDSFTVSLPNEIGQLEISDLDNGKDSVLVVMNTMGGEVIVTRALCQDNKIFLCDFTKNTLLFTGDSITLKNEVRVQASGQMYENNMLIINMIYDGEAETNERNFKIYGDDIRMAAMRN